MSLAGRTLLLTRPPERSAAFIEEAGRRGASVIAFPTIAIAPPESWEACDRALQAVESYQALAFTSANGVHWFFRRWHERRSTAGPCAGMAVYAVGERTAQALRDQGWHVTTIPGHFSAGALADALGSKGLHGLRFLLPQGNLAGDELAGRLRALGARVETVVVYRTLPVSPPDAEEVWARLASTGIDVVLFASPSAAASFARVYPVSRLGPLSSRTAIAVIGATTERAVLDLGWNPAIVAEEATLLDLLRSIEDFFS